MEAQLGCLVLIILATMFKASECAWCVCRADMSDSALQKTLDYACGAGADCSPTLQNGPCFQPNTVRAHCSYAVNSYYQRKAQAQGACVFAGTATLTSTDPSAGGCTYPASPSAAGTSTSTGTGTGTGTGTVLSPPGSGAGSGSGSGAGSGSTTPSTFSPPGTVLGGGGGLGPSGNSMSTDSSAVGLLPQHLVLLLLQLLFSAIIIMMPMFFH